MEPKEAIIRARRGDEAAWKIIIDHHQETVFRLAYLILGNYHDAGDVAQETFIRAYKKFWQFDPNRPLDPWLYRITSNLAYNFIRSRRRREAAKNRFGLENNQDVDQPEDLSMKEMEARELRNAVAKLKQKEQEVIFLRYFLGLSVEETSDSLGISPGTVKSRMHRALKQLLGVIERDFPSLERRFDNE